MRQKKLQIGVYTERASWYTIVYPGNCARVGRCGAPDPVVVTHANHKEITMKYQIQTTLLQRDANEQGADAAVEGVLLVGQCVASFLTNHSGYGYDVTHIKPAVYKGEHAWLRVDSWCAASGYSSSGDEETILTFEEGVRLLVEHGQFAVLFDVARKS